MKIIGFFIVLSLTILIGCTDDSATKNSRKPAVSLKVIQPTHNQHYDSGEKIMIDLEVINAEDIQNLTVLLKDSVIKNNIEIKSQTIEIETSNLPVGFNTIYISYSDKTGKARKATRNIIIFSDIIPEQKIATIVHTYPHKTDSYTQGLEFYNGYLYESTGSGDMTKSFIAKTDFVSGKHIAYKELENQNYFGEGITILNDTIYQLTWQDHQCLVYDMDFNYIKSFTYNEEGWGLTNKGKSLIMSNGSSSIVWRNPRTFEIEKEINVFSNEKDVPYLNELELINGDLWCNVYQTNFLVQVDTANGKVLAYIDCSGVVLDGMDDNSNVLNGIAYEPNTQKIYLTGKLWPKLYEVKID